MGDVKLMGQYSFLMTLLGSIATQSCSHMRLRGGTAGGNVSVSGYATVVLAKGSWLIIANKLR